MPMIGRSEAASVIPVIPSSLDRAVHLRLAVGSFLVNLADAARLADAIEAGDTFRVEWAPPDEARPKDLAEARSPGGDLQLLAGIATRADFVAQLRRAVKRLREIEETRMREKAARDQRATEGR